MPTFHKLSPSLLSRIDRLSGCQGRWIVDCRAIEGNYSYALRSLSDPWPFEQEDGHRFWHSLDGVPNLYKLSSPEDAAQYCAATKWKAKLLYSPSWLDADCSWPGGYEASSLYRSNNRTFQDAYEKELVLADGDADGLSLDIRYITHEMLEDIESLENYPLLSDNDHSELELEDQQKAWEDWVADEFSDALCKQLALIFSDEEDAEERAEALIDALSPSALYALFVSLSERTNTYWEEERNYGPWIDCKRIADALSSEDLPLP